MKGYRKNKYVSSSSNSSSSSSSESDSSSSESSSSSSMSSHNSTVSAIMARKQRYHYPYYPYVYPVHYYPYGYPNWYPEAVVPGSQNAPETVIDSRHQPSSESVNVKKEKIKKSKKTKREFLVTVSSIKGHPWQDRALESENCFSIDGIPGKVLYLKKGSRYIFTVYQPATEEDDKDFKLIFTTDPIGGEDARPLKGSPLTDSNGSYLLTVDQDYPEFFYYQCQNHRFVGGLIIVK